MMTRMIDAAKAEKSPASVSRARPTVSPRDKVERYSESPATRLMEGNKAGAIVSWYEMLSVSKVRVYPQHVALNTSSDCFLGAPKLSRDIPLK